MKFSLSTITIQQIQIFFAVVESNGFANAGINLHLTQSAISKSISRMESDLNITLFIRSTRKLMLTEAGKILYREWKEEVEKMNRAYYHAYVTQEKSNVSLRFGLLNIVHPELFFQKAVDDFRKLYPAVPVLTDSGNIGELEQKLDEWEYDAIFVPDIELNYIESRKWKWKYAARDNASVLMKADHPLSGRENLEIRDILDYDQITVCMKQRKDHFREDLNRRFAPFQKEPNVVFTYDNSYNLRFLLDFPDNALLLINRYIDFSGMPGKFRSVPVKEQYKGIICIWNAANRNVHLRNFLKLLPVYDVIN